MRLLAAFGLAVVLLAAAGLATRYFLMRQYYVGADGDQVVIYQGVPGSILGFDLHERAEGSCPPDSSLCEPLRLRDLEQQARETVRNGVTRDGLAESREYINSLRRNNMLQICDDTSADQGGGLGGVEQGGSDRDDSGTEPSPDPGADDGALGDPGGQTANTTAERHEGGQRPGVDCRPAPSSGGN